LSTLKPDHVIDAWTLVVAELQQASKVNEPGLAATTGEAEANKPHINVAAASNRPTRDIETSISPVAAARNCLGATPYRQHRKRLQAGVPAFWLWPTYGDAVAPT
jgi:hypothetical protein